MELGRLSAIWRFPIKSLRGEALASSRIERDGLPGDRVEALFVRAGHARRDKAYRGKEDERLHRLTDTGAARAAGAERGVVLDPRRGGRYFDDAPVSLVLSSWLDDVSQALGYAVEPLRFRANLYVTTARDLRVGETELVGAELTLGSVRLRVRDRIGRCVVTTYDPAGGASDPRVLRCIAEQRGNTLGVYCDVLEPGEVRLDDALVVFKASSKD